MVGCGPIDFRSGLARRFVHTQIFYGVQHESKALSQKDMPEVQGDSSPWRFAGYL